MSKIKKILTVLIMLLAIFVIKSNASNAESYYQIFSDEKFFKRDDKIGKEVSIPSDAGRNDYISYVQKYRGIWCLSENMQNTGSDLEVKGIIDIIGRNTIVKYNNSGNKATIENKVKETAYAAFAFAKTGSNTTNLWGRFYNRVLTNDLKTEFEDFKTRGSNSTVTGTLEIDGKKVTQKQYANYLNDAEVKVDSSGAYIKSSTGGYEGKDGQKYQYKIAGQTIDLCWSNPLVAERNVKINGKTYKIEQGGKYNYYYIKNGNSIVGRIVKNTGVIYLKDIVGELNPQKATIEIEFSVKYTALHVRLFILAGNTQQTRGLIKYKTEENTLTGKLTISDSSIPNPPDETIDVSMQKYIMTKGMDEATYTNFSKAVKAKYSVDSEILGIKTNYINAKKMKGDQDKPVIDSLSECYGSGNVVAEGTSGWHITISDTENRYFLKNIEKRYYDLTYNEIEVNLESQLSINLGYEFTDNITGRKNAQAYEGTTEDISYTYNYQNSNRKVNGTLNNTLNEAGGKRNNPIIINNGDYVAYRIVVYNNSFATDSNGNVTGAIPCGKVLVKDKFDGGDDAKLAGIYEENELGKDYTPISYEEKNGGYGWYANFSEASDCAKVYVVVVKYNSATEGKWSFKNYASIYKSGNKTEYRTEDYDYVEYEHKSTPKPEKEIIAVNGKVVLADESGNPGRVHLTQQQKKDNPLLVERGDTLTYQISIKNESNVEVKTTVEDIIGFEYDNLVVSDWSYEEGSGELPKLEQVEYKKLHAEGTMSKYSKATCTVTMRVTDIPDGDLDANKVIDWIPEHYTEQSIEYIKLKRYRVSLKKIIAAVNGTYIEEKTKDTVNEITRWDSWECDDGGKNKYAKHNNPLTIQKGDKVTYAIKVRNDGDTDPDSEYNTTVTIDILDEFIQDELGGLKLDSDSKTTGSVTLEPQKEYTFYVTLEVTESNMSTRLLRNHAKINGLKNINGLDVPDETLGNNEDADYVQTRDITIAGNVWNDTIGADKSNYNGIKDDYEKNLSGIKVQLYRETEGKVIATTETDENGNYSFSSSNIDANVVTHECERHIKAPYTCEAYVGNKHGANFWKENNYYSYYVIFEYNGVRYTSTTDGTSYVEVSADEENYTINSNAKEDNPHVSKTRNEFNKAFEVINNESGIDYDTIHDGDKNPQSIFKDNENMKIQASTNLIALSNNENWEDRLNNVSLGLRGKDSIDFELLSDIYSTKITVNGQEGTYNYNTDEVTLKRSDIKVNEVTVKPDTANVPREEIINSVTGVTQNIRQTDLKTDYTNSNYKDTGLGIELTYEATIVNSTKTPGKVTKIANYYDSRYEIKRIYKKDGIEVDFTKQKTNSDKYNEVLINVPDQLLKERESIDLYVVYELKNPAETLKTIMDDTSAEVKTLNLFEIYEYETSDEWLAEGQNIYTRGMIDLDSAPGSAENEDARIYEGNEARIDKEKTVQYYYNHPDNTAALRLEDDTSKGPTIFFKATDNKRTLSGTVFEDNTEIKEGNIKTGNGVKTNEENVVSGATVELIELNTTNYNSSEVKKYGDNNVVRYVTTTGTDGGYKFEGYLPGNYIVKYHYGDTDKTVLLYQDGEVNKHSYNGEDYQSTNNTGKYGAQKLNDTQDYWYVYNEKEGVSTGTDDENRRKTVTANVTTYSDAQMKVLNNIRSNNYSDADKAIKTIDSIINETKMNADTQSFTMKVEKSVEDNGNVVQNTSYNEYNVVNMNFGIAKVPYTTIDLQKHINSFEIKDSTGENVLAKAEKDENGEWTTNGDVLKGNHLFDVSIEDTKLQGARLEITYKITSKMNIERNFRNEQGIVATISGLVDFIDNDLTYNENLGNNKANWEVSTYDAVQETFGKSIYNRNTTPQGQEDANGTKHTTVIVAKSENPLLKQNSNGTAGCNITLEKTLSSEETTLEGIVTSNVNTYEYNNVIEITKFNYKNTNPKGEEESDIDYTKNDENDDILPYRDRVRTPTGETTAVPLTNADLPENNGGDIILAGTQHDCAVSETITIHPPTGENRNITYYIIAAVALIVLAAGTFGIRKFVIKKD